jgi:DNA-directed RNA polymerase subunit E'/Rpb7
MPDGWRPSAGVLDIDSGFAAYDIEFDSVVYRPFKNEIVLADVSEVTPVRVGTRTVACNFVSCSKH